MIKTKWWEREREEIGKITVRADVVSRWMGRIVCCCFSSLIKRGRIRLENLSDQFSLLFTQWQQFENRRISRLEIKVIERQFTHGWCCWDDEADEDEPEMLLLLFVDHTGGSRFANVDESDQQSGGNGNQGKIGESESVERVGVREMKNQLGILFKKVFIQRKLISLKLFWSFRIIHFLHSFKLKLIWISRLSTVFRH